MRRRSLLKTVLILAALLALSLGIVVSLLKQEPDFYVRESQDGNGADDSVQAGKVITRLNELMEDMRASQNRDWGKSFSAEELNAFFRERESGNNPLTKALLADLPNPRVAIDGDRLRIAFRHGDEKTSETNRKSTPFFSTVVVLELRMWLVKDESNLVAVEIVGFKAGALPLPKSWVIEEVGSAARRMSADVSWYRKESNPVALCKLYANQSRPETQVTTLRIGDGALSIGGRHTGQQPGEIK